MRRPRDDRESIDGRTRVDVAIEATSCKVPSAECGVRSAKWFPRNTRIRSFVVERRQSSSLVLTRRRPRSRERRIASHRIASHRAEDDASLSLECSPIVVMTTTTRTNTRMRTQTRTTPTPTPWRGRLGRARTRTRTTRCAKATNENENATTDDDDDDDEDGGERVEYERAIEALIDARVESNERFLEEVKNYRRRGRLTMKFFDACEAMMDDAETRGDVERKDEIDAMCAEAMARMTYSVEEIVRGMGFERAVGDGDEESARGEQTLESGLTLAQEKEVRERWVELTRALATTGEANARAQGTLNEESRRNAITEIAGRVALGAVDMERLMRVAPERRIADVLLTIPRGTERASAVEDALTPPDEGENVDGDEENEVVFTTAPKLLNVVEIMLRDARAAGDATRVAELDELAALVEAKCEL